MWLVWVLIVLEYCKSSNKRRVSIRRRVSNRRRGSRSIVRISLNKRRVSDKRQVPNNRRVIGGYDGYGNWLI